MITARDRFIGGFIPVPESGCWIWEKELSKNGYGRFRTEDRKWKYAHRYSHEVYRGAIPVGLQIDHLCRVRCCVNPLHMEVVTPQENTRRGFGISIKNAAKTHCKNGHAFDADNTLMRPLSSGGIGRRCKICLIDKWKRQDVKRKLLRMGRYPKA